MIKNALLTLLVLFPVDFAEVRIFIGFQDDRKQFLVDVLAADLGRVAANDADFAIVRIHDGGLASLGAKIEGYSVYLAVSEMEIGGD